MTTTQLYSRPITSGFIANFRFRFDSSKWLLRSKDNFSWKKTLKVGRLYIKMTSLTSAFIKRFFFSGSPGVKNPKTGQIFNLDLKVDLQFSTFNDVRNLILNALKFVIWPKTQIFSVRITNFLDLTDHLELFLWKFISPVI